MIGKCGIELADFVEGVLLQVAFHFVKTENIRSLVDASL